MGHNMVISDNIKEILKKRKVALTRSVIAASAMLMVIGGLSGCGKKESKTPEFTKIYSSVVVKEGDTLDEIIQSYMDDSTYKNAEVYKTVKAYKAEICEINHIGNPNNIKADCSIIIPYYVDQQMAIEIENTNREKDQACTVSYSVRAGDNLWNIAQHYGITVEKLAADNDIKKETIIQPGDLLTIHTSGQYMDEDITDYSVDGKTR